MASFKNIEPRAKLPKFLRERAKDLPAHRWALADMCDEAADEIKRLQKIMNVQMYELMGAEIDLKREGANQICLDTINRAIAALSEK